MFRKMRRFKQQISEEKCVEILTREPRGVMAFAGDDGYPYAIPLNFVYDGGKLYFHCAPEGHKLDAIRRCDKVSFCVMDKGYRKDGDWALNINSVVVFGRIAENSVCSATNTRPTRNTSRTRSTNSSTASVCSK